MGIGRVAQRRIEQPDDDAVAGAIRHFFAYRRSSAGRYRGRGVRSASFCACAVASSRLSLSATRNVIYLEFYVFCAPAGRTSARLGPRDRPRARSRATGAWAQEQAGKRDKSAEDKTYRGGDQYQAAVCAAATSYAYLRGNLLLLYSLPAATAQTLAAALATLYIACAASARRITPACGLRLRHALHAHNTARTTRQPAAAARQL